MEKEPQFREAKEADEKEPKQPTAPDTSLPTPETKAIPPSLAEEVNEPAPETDEVSVAFESLPQLVGKNILFRDPHTQPNRTDDPYHKVATIEQQDGKFVIVVDRGSRYYPYYTGNRQNIFALDSQADIDRYEVKLEG